MRNWPEISGLKMNVTIVHKYFGLMFTFKY